MYYYIHNYMPVFKPKTNKKIKISKKNITTLDGKHREFMNEFAKNELNEIPKLKQEYNDIENILKTNDLAIDQVMEYKDRLQEIIRDITYLKNKKTKYYLDNSHFIFEYFENKKNISNTDTTKNGTSKNKIVDNFFKIKTEEQAKPENINKNIVYKYLCNIDESFMEINSFVHSSDVCEHCFKGELIPMEDEGLLICNVCSVNVPYLIENEKPSYKEPPKEVCFYAYKKINHFKEILAQYQGKETTQIPSEVIETIKLQIKKERIELSQLNHYKTKEVLKKLGYNKYYEHIAFIKNKLGIQPPVMSPELEETLCNLFMELQSPYSKNCPDYRVNFLNYYYVLYKLCELLGEAEYLHDIPMLKDREKLIEQDETWKKMCEELNWEFIPTI
uniref:Uncharacterized protein n=1 Tax=viral metagenome TaxID=1070528 RepID=A0A6C0E1E7_9ZZZZ